MIQTRNNKENRQQPAKQQFYGRGPGIHRPTSATPAQRQRLQLRQDGDPLHEHFNQQKRRSGQQQANWLAFHPTNPLHPGIPRASKMMDDNFRSGVMGDQLHTKLTRSQHSIAKYVQIFESTPCQPNPCFAAAKTPAILKRTRCQPSAMQPEKA